MEVSSFICVLICIKFGLICSLSAFSNVNSFFLFYRHNRAKFYVTRYCMKFFFSNVTSFSWPKHTKYCSQYYSTVTFDFNNGKTKTATVGPVRCAQTVKRSTFNWRFLITATNIVCVKSKKNCHEASIQIKNKEENTLKSFCILNVFDLFTNMCVCVCPYLSLLFVWEANTTSVLAFDLIKNVINFQIVLITCSYLHTFTFRMSNHKKTCTTTNPSFAYILESNFCLYAIHTVNYSIHSYVFHWSALIWFHFTLRMWAAVCCCYASTGYRSFHYHTYTCRSRRLSICIFNHVHESNWTCWKFCSEFGFISS